MTPKNSDYSSDESQPSEEGMEEEMIIPRSTGSSSANTTEVISPPSSSSSISPMSSVSYCDNHTLTNERNSMKRKHEVTFLQNSSTGKIPARTNDKPESLSSSLSVPSSPEPTLSPTSHNNNQKDHQESKESPVAYLYSPRNNNNNNRYLSSSYASDNVPRTAPCIVLSPNINHSMLFNHHNGPLFNPSSPSSSLMMSHHPHPHNLHPHLHINHPPPPFQMFHHHQSTLMSKINPLCFKTVDVGMQRFREFCADHNFNSVGSGFKSVKCNNNNNGGDEHETGEKEGNDKKRSKETHEDEERVHNNANDKEEPNDKSLRSQSTSDESPAVIQRLSFGIDRILAEKTEKADVTPEKAILNESFSDEGLLDDEERNNNTKDPISKRSLISPSSPVTRAPILYHPPHNHHQNPNHHHFNNNNNSPDNNNSSSSQHRHLHCLPSSSPLNLTNRCGDCYLLGRFCRNTNNASSGNNSLHYSSLVSSSSGVVLSGGGGGGSNNNSNGVSASFSPWMTNASIYENSPLLSPSAYHTQSTLTSAYNMGNAGYSTMSSLVSCNNNVGPGGRRKRSWSRAVFSSLQRKGLEKRFQIQKYITKPDRRQLAATLGLTDAQVKVWFQNRRMKWRHSKEGKVTSGVGDEGISVSTTVISSASNSSGDGQKSHPIIIGASSSSSSSSAIIDMKT